MDVYVDSKERGFEEDIGVVGKGAEIRVLACELKAVPCPSRKYILVRSSRNCSDVQCRTTAD